MWYELTIPTVLLNIRHMGAAPPSSPRTSGTSGQKGPRGAVLVQLKRARQLTAKELAGRLGVSLNAVRHHLKELEAEGLVEYEREHRGVGAPVFAYRLSAGGRGPLPSAVRGDADRAAGPVVEREGREAAVALLESLLRRASPAGFEAELAGCTPAERLQALGRVLSEEGYMAEVHAAAAERHADRAQLRHPGGGRAVSRDLRGGGTVPRRRAGRRGRAPRAHAERLQRLRIPRAVQARSGELMSSSVESLVNQGVQVRLRHRHRVRCRAEGAERGHHPAHLGQEAASPSGCSSGGSRRIAAG